MSKPILNSPERGPSHDLLRELHGFLSLEAPFLLRDLPGSVTEVDLEVTLMERLDHRFRSGRYGDEELYPFHTHQRAVEEAHLVMRTRLKGFFERWRIRDSITAEERLEMLHGMLLTRAVDNFLKDAFDRKEIAWGKYPSPQKGFRSTGQEAIVGAALRLRRPPKYAPGEDYSGDFFSPLIRDLGALLMFRPDPLHPILVQYGKLGTPVGGRDLHTGDFSHGVLPPAAPLAIAVQTIIGLAYAWKVRGEDRVGVTCIGEGGASLGEWHEAVNFAAVQNLNLVFIVENNQWALGTHVSEQTRARRLALRAEGYGINGLTIRGNDPDDVAAAVSWAAEKAREGAGPTLIELVTYRRSGHAHHDDPRFHGNPEAKIPGYEVGKERRAWEALDPVDLYERKLVDLGVAGPAEIEEAREAAAEKVALAGEAATKAPWPESGTTEAFVFAPAAAPQESAADVPTKRMSYDEAVRDGMASMMEADPRVFVLGEDVGGRYGGAFAVTRGLAKRFGAERCLNMPLAESAIVGCGVGSALSGLRPIVEMQFADFLAPAFNALVNNAAKVHWRWGRPVPMVVRLPYGAATGTMNPLLGGGPFHSQCPEMWFVRVPGFKIVAPSTPADAKGLMLAAIRDDNPVIYLEAKGLYGFFRTDLKEAVPLGVEGEVPIGVAAVRREGRDATLLTYGAMTWTAMAAAEAMAEEGFEIEVIDLRTLVPLDTETIARSVEKTGRVLILHEDTRRGGFAGEIAALLSDEMFYFLDAPVRRVTAPDTPVPYSPPLEFAYLPKFDGVVEALRKLLAE